MTTSKIITIINQKGLHARAAGAFVKESSKYKSEIEVEKGEMKVLGTSVMGLMMLGASKGTQIKITANGSDEKEALEGITALIERSFDEE
jgi:phosphocarrier protein